ncbi:hypothetical protein BSKO_08977 [Bryopsis sp. KO-2023]|nr:hypothetical protein BSKO_08977 [Bryopsis sp. KO-2023]
MSSVTLSLVCFLAVVGNALCKNRIVQLRQFSVIHTEVPFNVLVRPSGGQGEYRMVIDADRSVRNALKTNVVNGVLLVSMSGSYSTNRQIKVVFEMPADQLRRVEKMGANSVVVGPSFNPSTFEVLNKGTGLVWVVEMRSSKVRVNSEDAGTISLKGPIQEVVATADGSSKVYLKNIQDHADITALGATQVYVEGPSWLRVNGKTAVSASIRASGTRQCETTSAGFFSFTRRCSTFLRSRVPKFNPTWTCSASGVSNTSGSVSSSGGSFATTSFSGSASASASGSARSSGTFSFSGRGSSSFGGVTSTSGGSSSARTGCGDYIMGYTGK